MNNPVPGIGVIPGKCSLDFVLIQEYQANSEDPRTSLDCYPGGNQPINHDAMPGDTSYGQKNVRNSEVMDGEPNELGIVSVAGLNWGRYCSQREMEDDFYWQGVVTTESRLTNPLDGITGDPDHGYGTGRAGTFSVINNGWKTIYAGNYVAWQFPQAPFHPKGDVYNFNGGETTNYLARYGVPTTQFRPEYVPFDQTDFTVQMAAAFAAMSTPKDQGGVSNLGFVASLPNVNGASDKKPWTAIQDEANSYKYGFWGVGLTLVETLICRGLLVAGPGLDAAIAELNAGQYNAFPDAAVTNAVSAAAHETSKNLARAIGLFDTNEDGQKVMLEGIADIMLKNISPEDVRRGQAVDRFAAGSGREFIEIATSEPRDAGDMYDRLRIHLTDVLLTGVTGSWYSKTSRIVGKSMNSGK